MAQLAISVVGAGIGYAVGGPFGASVGWAIGSVAGSFLFSETIEGPKLEDLKVQASTYGAPIPITYGTVRLAGNMIWASDLQAHTEEESAKGGPTVENTTYTVSVAVGLCEGEIAGVTRIWANKKLVYDSRAGNPGNMIDPDAFTSAPRVYLGTETQTADSLIVAHKGSSPAYRGLAYVVLEDFKLAEYGNRCPQWEFEVVKAGTGSMPDPTAMGAAGEDGAVDPLTGYVWSVHGVVNTKVVVDITDNSTLSLVQEIETVPSAVAGSMGNSICYVTATREFWVASESSTPNIMIYDAGSQTYSGGIDFGLSWFGLARLEPTTGYVWLGRTNLGEYIKVIDPIARTVVATLTAAPGGGIGPIHEILPIDGTRVAALTTDYVTIFDPLLLSTVETYSVAGMSSTSDMAYDPSRDRLIVVDGADATYYTIDLASHTATLRTLTAGPTPPPDYSTTVRDVLPHQQTDRYYFTAHQAGLDWTLHTVNPDTFATERTWTYNGPTNTGTMFEVPGALDYFVYTDNSSGSAIAYRIPLTERLTADPAILADIVRDLCTRTALTAGDVDVTALTDEVDGYVVASQMSVRAAIEPLQQAYYFDAVESDNVLKFVKRGGAIAVTIPEDDRAAHQHEQPLPDALKILRAHEQELPLQVDVEYFDLDADYLIGSQYDRRITRDADGTQNIRLPIVMPATKGKQVAMVNLYTAWLARQRYAFSTSRKYTKYEPTDVVTLPTASATYNARIVAKREGANGVIEWEAVAEDSSSYTQTGEPGASGYVPQTITIPSSLATVLELLDVPLLRDVDDNAGFYAAASSASAEWDGANLYQSSNGGYSYSLIAGLPASVIGYSTTALGDFTGGNIFDEGNTVDVLLYQGSLANASAGDVLNGANAAVLGSEIIQFTTATLVGGNTWRLSGLLRGRRGTEWATGTHSNGERFVLASTSAWRRPSLGTAEIGAARLWKAPAWGTLLSAATSESFTNTAIGLKPYSPCFLASTRDGSSNLALTWIRRTRVGGEWRDNVDATLGETTEAYEVEIWTTDFATLKRTITGLTTPTTTYTAAQQTTDFGSPQSSVGVKVYQISATVGRGYALQGLA